MGVLSPKVEPYKHLKTYIYSVLGNRPINGPQIAAAKLIHHFDVETSIALMSRNCSG